MRILLVGEYSNLHNSLKSGLIQAGHQVTLISTGDAFKKFPADVKFSAKRIEGSSLLRFLRKVIFKIFRVDIAFLEIGYRCLDWLVDQKNYDVIQLINEYPLKTPYFFEKRIFSKKYDNKLSPESIVHAPKNIRITPTNIAKEKNR